MKYPPFFPCALSHKIQQGAREKKNPNSWRHWDEASFPPPSVCCLLLICLLAFWKLTTESQPPSESEPSTRTRTPSLRLWAAWQKLPLFYICAISIHHSAPACQSYIYFKIFMPEWILIPLTVFAFAIGSWRPKSLQEPKKHRIKIKQAELFYKQAPKSFSDSVCVCVCVFDCLLLICICRLVSLYVCVSEWGSVRGRCCCSLIKPFFYTPNPKHRHDALQLENPLPLPQSQSHVEYVQREKILY